jgi:hypothetical protein
MKWLINVLTGAADKITERKMWNERLHREDRQGLSETSYIAKEAIFPSWQSQSYFGYESR